MGSWPPRLPTGPPLIRLDRGRPSAPTQPFLPHSPPGSRHPSTPCSRVRSDTCAHTHLHTSTRAPCVVQSGRGLSTSGATCLWPGSFAEPQREASPGCGLIAGLLTLHQEDPGTELKGAPAPACGAEDGATRGTSLLWKSQPQGAQGEEGGQWPWTQQCHCHHGGNRAPNGQLWPQSGAAAGPGWEPMPRSPPAPSSPAPGIPSSMWGPWRPRVELSLYRGDSLPHAPVRAALLVG